LKTLRINALKAEYDEKLFNIYKERKSVIADGLVNKWISEGKLLPKNKDFALAILCNSDDAEINFSDDVKGTVAQLLCQIMDNQEPVISFKQSAGKTAKTGTVDEDAAKIAEKYFGLNKEEFEKFSNPDFKI